MRVARRGDRPLTEVAADFDVSVKTLYRWVHHADVDAGVRDGMTTAEQAEIARPILERHGKLLNIFRTQLNHP